MEPISRDAVVAALEANLRHIERVVARLDDARATSRPPSGGWSPLDALEHLVAVERGVHRAVTGAAGAEPTALRTRELDPVVAGAGVVTRTLEAPAQVAPKGRFASIGEAMVVFRERRLTTLSLARTLDVPWESHHAPHPILGMLDVGQWFLLAATHGERHVPQMGG